MQKETEEDYDFAEEPVTEEEKRVNPGGMPEGNYGHGIQGIYY